MDAVGIAKLVEKKSRKVVADEEFQDAAKQVATLSDLSDDQKLVFYGLFKQATVGNVNISSPWAMDVVGKAKWNQWNKFKGCSLTTAKLAYVHIFEDISGRKIFRDSSSSEQSVPDVWKDVDSVDDGDIEGYPIIATPSPLTTMTAAAVATTTTPPQNFPSRSSTTTTSTPIAAVHHIYSQNQQDQCLRNDISAQLDEDENDPLNDSTCSILSDHDVVNFNSGLEVKPFMKSKRKARGFIFALVLVIGIMIFDIRNNFALYKFATETHLFNPPQPRHFSSSALVEPFTTTAAAPSSKGCTTNGGGVQCVADERHQKLPQKSAQIRSAEL